MLLKDYKYYFLLIVILKCSIFCNAQITPANIVYIQNFGQGTYGDDNPVFEFRIEDGNGQLIKKDTTRPGVPYAAAKFFHSYGFDFTIPNGVTTLVPKVTCVWKILPLMT